MAAAAVDPAIGPAIGPYAVMTAGPGCLDAVERRARAVYGSGRRPAPAPGPGLRELVRSTMAPV